jgi:hypothetical protein
MFELWRYWAAQNLYVHDNEWNPMNYQDSVHVYEALKSGDEHLRLQLLRTAIRYTNMRVEWLFMTSAERLEVDRQRTAAHNAFIDAVNILSRSMGQSGQDNSWRQVLGENRKDIGDFACFLVAHLGILAR